MVEHAGNVLGYPGVGVPECNRFVGGAELHLGGAPAASVPPWEAHGRRRTGWGRCSGILQAQSQHTQTPGVHVRDRGCGDVRHRASVCDRDRGGLQPSALSHRLPITQPGGPYWPSFTTSQKNDT